MTSPPPAGNGARLTYMAPLSATRAERLVADLAVRSPSTVVDLGCGWAELLLRVLAACPGAKGVGLDTHEPDLARGRANAGARGLDGRVTFVDGPAADHRDPADLLVSVGAYQAFGTIAEALNAMRAMVNPGGRVLFAAEFWESPPPPDRLARMWPGMSADDCTDLAGLVDQAIAAGFRPLRVETATRDEWDEFESLLAADREEWLITHPDHPEAAAVRAQADTQRDIWLRGHRGLMGFAYLTLGPI
ncbi:SAM-dependent methyltransferase [Asanoa ishikariensis]|uniref:Methyltransferase domain-containing protein n=1 Tax=Asanoa ishikariensis TaxID=137265 RepID=A0A1H3UHS5_9ACTN|nr:methyltransferase [Asanoa ishikariensis]GIF63510.1 SAM-dependent methyltransferase [Asanoa ishikariensis]SDZ61867.1 Methyltransferase domain-containing protein [Asanoa ishikariensis]